MDLIAIGDVMIDVRVDAPALARGGDVHGRVRLQPGGTSANAVVWAAWAGATASVVARVGDDIGGGILRDALAARGVEPHLTVDPEAPTGTMLVVVDRAERSMVADRGASGRFSHSDLPPSLDAGAVLVSGYLLLFEATTHVALDALRRASAGFIAVEAASWPMLDAYGGRRFVARTTEAGANAVFANEREAEVLTGLSGAASARSLGERYRIACVKLGDSGAATSFEGSLLETPAEPVEPIDSTGAGDAFDGVVLAALAGGEEPEAALRLGCHAGALAAESALTWPAVSAT